MSDLEQLTQENIYYTFDTDCVRKRSNMSKSSDSYKFDNEHYDPIRLLKDIQTQSPKIHALLHNIEKVDKADMKRDGTQYKHFIFCDLKSGSYGAKLLASALIASGKIMGYSATRKDSEEGINAIKVSNQKVREDTPRPSDKLTIKRMPKFQDLDVWSEGEEESMKGGDHPDRNKKMYNKIMFRDEDELQKTKYDNFFLLSSVDVYDQSITVKDKKRILDTFNKRPENIHGENIRFIIMDSGFKEGIDLFDVRYVHIFEPSVNNADEKQVVGRSTRTCGQKGLEFHPTQGWPLHVFVYDLAIPEPLQRQFLGSKTAMELYMQSLNIDVRKIEFGNDLEQTVIFGSVDYELNRKIHSFKLSEYQIANQLYGGGPKLAPKIVIDPLKPVLVVGKGGQEIVLPSGQTVEGIQLQDMGFEKMRKYVHDYFRHCSWKDVKMENNCQDKKGDASKESIIEYTPTQRFVQEYFTPQCPVKGLLLWHSVGTGKTCSAIAAATSSFVPQGYTCLL